MGLDKTLSTDLFKTSSSSIKVVATDNKFETVDVRWYKLL